MEIKIQITLDPQAWKESFKKPHMKALALLACIMPLGLFAVSKPYTFTDGQTISAAQVNGNFDTIYTSFNTQDQSLTALKDELMPTSCPTGMILAGAAGTESAFCIESNERSGLYYHEAVRICSAAGRHVCSLNQYWVGLVTSGMSNMTNNWEWVSDRDDANSGGHLQVIVGGSGNHIQSWAWAGEHGNMGGPYAYRCCKGAISALFD